ncbi:hypothetical protein GCM10027299_00550 [Larkinella ripae]
MICPPNSRNPLSRLPGIFFFLAVFSLLLSACEEQKELTPEETANARIACVGNSITQGERLQSGEKNYPQQLQLLVGTSDTVQNYGVSGSTVLKKGTSPYWNQSAYQDALSWNPGTVVIELGTNDTKSVNWQYKSEFKDNYIELVRSFQNLPSKPVVYLCKPTPAFKFMYDINPETIKNDILPLIDEVARQTRVKVIDLYTPLESSDSLFIDGIHPNAEGARIIAGLVRQAIRPNPAAKTR